MIPLETTVGDDWIADLRRDALTNYRARANAVTRGVVYALAATLAIVAASYWAGYDSGRDDATFAIAKGCALDNRFTHDGVAFSCIDENDYYAE